MILCSIYITLVYLHLMCCSTAWSCIRTSDIHLLVVFFKKRVYSPHFVFQTSWSYLTSYISCLIFWNFEIWSILMLHHSHVDPCTWCTSYYLQRFHNSLHKIPNNSSQLFYPSVLTLTHYCDPYYRKSVFV